MASEIILAVCQLAALLLMISEILVFLMGNWMFAEDEPVKQFLMGLALCLIPVVMLVLLQPMVSLLYWLLPKANYSYLILGLVVILTAGCLMKSAQLVVNATEYTQKSATLLTAIFFGIPLTCFTALLLAEWQYGGWVIAACLVGITPAVVSFVRRIHLEVTSE